MPFNWLHLRRKCGGAGHAGGVHSSSSSSSSSTSSSRTMDFIIIIICKWQSTINTILQDNNNRIFNMLLLHSTYCIIRQRERKGGTWNILYFGALPLCPPASWPTDQGTAYVCWVGTAAVTVISNRTSWFVGRPYVENCWPATTDGDNTIGASKEDGQGTGWAGLVNWDSRNVQLHYGVAGRVHVKCKSEVCWGWKGTCEVSLDES